MGTFSYGARSIVRAGLQPSRPAVTSDPHLPSQPDSLPQASLGWGQLEVVHSGLRTKSSPVSIRAATFVVGILLLLGCALGAELAVIATVEAAFGLVAKVYHQMSLPRHDLDEDRVSPVEEEEVSPTREQATTPGSPVAHRAVGKRHMPAPVNRESQRDKAGLTCLTNPRGCP